jgi:hypothetical protein
VAKISTGDPDLDAVANEEHASDPPVVTGDPDMDTVIAEPHWYSPANLAKKYTGFQEGQLSGLTGGIASLGGGLTYLGTLAATGGDTKAAKAVQEETQNALTYEPRSREGKKQAAALNEAGSYLGQKEGEFAGGEIADLGFPGIGAAVNTGFNAIPFVLGARVGAEAPMKFGEAPRVGEVPKPKAGPETFAEETPAAPKAETNSPDMEAKKSVLRSVGLDQARTSALENNGPAAMSEWQTSRDPTTGQGLEARKVFDRERDALVSHSEGIARDTGGSSGLDTNSLETRGNTILRPFEMLEDWFDKKRQGTYAAADTVAKQSSELTGGIRLRDFEDVLGDESHLTNSDRIGLKNGLTARLKQLNMLGEDGSIRGTAAQAETVRKYINENWSPQNSGFAGKLKTGIDNSVVKAAGEDIYKDSRATVEQQKNTLENPAGLGKLLDASGPNEMNRKVAAEKVPDAIMNMPAVQVRHIMDTLDTMPPEIQEAAQAAKAEMQAHVAHRLTEAGSTAADSWNNKNVNQFMDKNAARLDAIYGKDHPLLQKMRNLRAAGNILRVDRRYPGAAIQGRILQSTLVPGAITGAGTLIGSKVGLAFGHPVAGGTMGASAVAPYALKVRAAAGRKAVQKRMTPLGPEP